jgi:hypothetical protein
MFGEPPQDSQSYPRAGGLFSGQSPFGLGPSNRRERPYGSRLNDPQNPFAPIA